MHSDNLHHWHHEPQIGGRVNFANLSPLMDLMFGTYHDPGHMPERYGMDQDLPHGYVRQLVDPVVQTVVPRRLREAAARRAPGLPWRRRTRPAGEPGVAALRSTRTRGSVSANP